MPCRLGRLRRLGVEVPEHFHVVADEAQGDDDDASTPSARSARDHVVDVGLEPRLGRRARAALVDQLPRDVGARPRARRPRRRRGAARRRRRLAEVAIARSAPLGIGARDAVGREQDADRARVDAALHELGDGGAHPVDEGLDESGVVEELAHLVDLRCGRRVRSARGPSAKSSRYWRQLEYELYALVASPMSRVKPRSAASSKRLGEVRLPVAVAPQHRQVDAAATPARPRAPP